MVAVRDEDVPSDFIAAQLKGIIGFEIPIRRLEGKWKVSQNRTRAEREGVIAGLAQLDTPESLAMSEMVAKALEGSSDTSLLHAHNEAGVS